MANFLLYGSDESKIRLFIKNQIKTISDVQEKTFVSTDDDQEELMSFIENENFFISNRACIIIGLSSFNLKMRDYLIQYLKNPLDNVWVFITFKSKRDIPPKLESSFNKSEIKVFYPMFENQRAGFIRNILSKDLIKIDSQALNLLLDKTENDEDLMKNVALSISSYMKSQKKNLINISDIKYFLAHTKQENIDSLFEAFLERDLSKALNILHVLLNSKTYDNTYLLISFSFKLLNLLSIINYANTNKMDYDFAMQNMPKGVKYKPLRDKIVSALTYYSKDLITRYLRWISHLDTQIKESSSDIGFILLERLFIMMINRSNTSNYFHEEL